MQTHLEEHPDYKKKIDDDPIELLKTIKESMHKPVRVQYDDNQPIKMAEYEVLRGWELFGLCKKAQAAGLFQTQVAIFYASPSIESICFGLSYTE